MIGLEQIETIFNSIKSYYKFLITAYICCGIEWELLKLSAKADKIIFILMIVICFVIFFAALVYTSKKDFYKPFEDSFEQIGIDGIAIPLSILVGIILMAAYCFAALSGLMADLGYIILDPQLKKNDIGPLYYFYLWHFFDLVPQIKITETLQWDVPFKYNSKLMASLVLIYKSIMVWIIITQILWVRNP